MNGTCNSELLLVPAPLGPWGGAKSSNIINLNYKVNFKDFLNQTLCVFSQMKDIKHIKTGFSFSPLGHAPVFGTWGAGGQKFHFLNMVMWHIKLKGMSSRPGYIEIFTLRLNR